MKKNEIALIILIVSIVAAATYFIFAAIMPTPGKTQKTVETAEAFQSSVVEPSTRVFNDQAINPTVKVKIGGQSDQQPFTINQ